jgi:hypothetical protein
LESVWTAAKKSLAPLAFVYTIAWSSDAWLQFLLSQAVALSIEPLDGTFGSSGLLLVYIQLVERTCCHLLRFLPLDAITQIFSRLGLHQLTKTPFE